MAASPPGRSHFWAALAFYGLLVSLLGLPVLIGDCGAGGGDIATRCAAARSEALLYLGLALLIPLVAAILRRCGLRGWSLLLVAGWRAPVLAVMLAAWVGGEG